jgi:hypothetical protein
MQGTKMDAKDKPKNVLGKACEGGFGVSHY